jgi:hypothetical protein
MKRMWLAGVAAAAVLTGAVAGPASLAGAGSGAAPVLMPTTHSPHGAATTAPPNVGLLTYHGGPVAHSVTVSTVFWMPPGWTMSPGYQTLINQWVGDLSNSAPYSIAQQYPDGQGAPGPTVVLGSTVTDIQPFPGGRGSQATPLTDADIRAEVTQSGFASDANHEVFVFLPKDAWLDAGGGSLSFTSFCAYHFAYPDAAPAHVYAAMPYVGTVPSACEVPVNNAPAAPNGNADADNEINIVSHELFEMVTDPLYAANGGFSGWYYQDTSGEIGDQCNFVFGPRDSTGGDVVLNGHHYVMQEEWSNNAAQANGISQAGGCVLSSLTATSMQASPAVVTLSPLGLTNFQLRATLTVHGAGPLANAAVTFDAGTTRLCSTVTDASGVARCDASANALPVLLALGYTASFAGDATYLGSGATGALVG